MTFEQFHAVCEDLSLGDVCFVARGKTEPGGDIWKFPEQFCQRLRFDQRRDRFTRQNICARFDQGFQARAVKIHEFFFGQAIIPAIFGAICEERTVWSDGGGDEWFDSPDAVRFVRPEFVTRGDGKVDGFLEQGIRLAFVQSAFHEAFERGLITGGDGAVRAGFEVVVVELLDGFGFFKQDLCRPQVIVEVEAAAFEFGGERAVHNEGRLMAPP